MFNSEDLTMALLNKIYHNFRSDIDKMLDEFNAKHRLTASQQAEYDKHARIQQLRDHKQSSQQDRDMDDIWTAF